MRYSLADWTHTLRDHHRRRVIERRLLELVARLPHEPESRSTYQKLLDEHNALAEGPSRERQHDLHLRPSKHPA